MMFKHLGSERIVHHSHSIATPSTPNLRKALVSHQRLLEPVAYTHVHSEKWRLGSRVQRDRLSLQEQYRGDPLCTAASISQVNVVNDIWILGNRMVLTQI